jgi:hypothetical protein
VRNWLLYLEQAFLYNETMGIISLSQIKVRLKELGKDYWVFLIIVLAPLSLYVINSEWIFPEPWIVDSYLSNRYAFFYDHLDFFHEPYKIERVSWHITVNWITKLIGGRYLLEFWGLFSYVLMGLLYYLNLSELYGRKRAQLFLPFIIFYPQLISHSSGGGTYHNLFTSNILLMSLWLWTKAMKTKKGPDLWFFSVLAGVFLGTDLISNFIHLNLGLLFFAIPLHLGKRVRVTDLMKLALGVLLGYIIWGLLNLIVIGDWVSFTRRFEILLKHTNPDHFFNSWYLPLESGFFLKKYSFKYLGAYLLSALVFLLMPFFNKSWRSWRYALAYHASFVVSLWFVWHALGIQALLPPDFSYSLQIPVFLAWPLFFTEAPNLKKKSFILLILATSALLMGSNTIFGPWTDSIFSGSNFIFKSSLLILLSSSLLLLNHRRQSIGFESLSLVVLIFFWAVIYDPYKKAKDEPCPQNKASYLFFNQSAQSLLSLDYKAHKYFVLNLPWAKTTIKSGVCQGLSWRYGAVLHSLDWAMASLLYRVPPSEVWSAQTYDEVLDDEFFRRIHRHRGRLVVFEPDFNRLGNLRELATNEGLKLVEENSFKSTFLDQSFMAKVYQLTTLSP